MKKGWEVKSLGEVCKFQGGTQPPKSEFVDSPRPGYVRLLQIRDFKSDERAVYVRDNGKVKKCEINDIMIGRYGASVGQIHRGKAGAYNVALIKTIPDETRLLRDYFYYFLTSDLFQLPLIQKSARGAQNGFNQEDIGPFPVPLPPLPEQKRIVEVLDKAFEGLAIAKANAEANLQNCQAIVTGYLAKVFAQNDSWITIRLGDVASKIGSGATPRGGKNSYKDSGVPLIRSLNVHDRRFVYDDLARLDSIQATALNNVIVQSGDVLLNITGASIARCCTPPNDVLPARVNQHVMIIRADSRELESDFLCLLLTSKPYKEKLLGIGEKAGATRQALTKAMVEDFLVRAPNIGIQRQIVARAKEIEAAVERTRSKYEDKFQSIERLKQSLLQKAFAGELT